MPAEAGQGPGVSYPQVRDRGSDSTRAAPVSQTQGAQGSDGTGGGTPKAEAQGSGQPSALDLLRQQASQATAREAQARKDYANLQPAYTQATQQRNQYRDEANGLKQEVAELRRQSEEYQKAFQAYRNSGAYSGDEGSEITSVLAQRVDALSKQLEGAYERMAGQEEKIRAASQGALIALQNDQQYQQGQRVDQIRQNIRRRFGTFEPQVENYMVEVWQRGDIDAALDLAKQAEKAVLERATAETRQQVSRQDNLHIGESSSRRSRPTAPTADDMKHLTEQFSDRADRIAAAINMGREARRANQR